MRTALPQPRSRIIRRTRLLDKLARWPETRLIQVVAPAGYGKTTLAALWLHELASDSAAPRPHIAWISLSDDIGAEQFLSLFIDALTPHIPAISDLRNADGGADFTALARIDAFCREIAAAQRPFLLIIDDLHLVTNTAAHTLLQRILDAAPDSLHLVLLSRTIPPLHLGRYILEDAVITLDARDLAFDHDEFLAFARDLGLAMQPAEALAALEQRSTGWIAGLKLLAYGLRYDPTSVHTPGADAALDEFFSARVFAALPTDLQHFCDFAEPLPFMTAELMAAVAQCSIADTDARLHALAAANTFVTVFSSPVQKHISYRFHPLFHDFLHRRALQHRPESFDAAERAAIWLCDHDDVDSALALLKSDDRRPTTDSGTDNSNDHLPSAVCRRSSVIDSLAAAVRRAVLRYDHTAVKRWLQAIPAEWVAAHAPLSIAAGWHALAIDPPDMQDMIIPWQRAATAVAALPLEPQFDELRAESAVLQALHSLAINDRAEFQRRIIAVESAPHAADGLAAAYISMLRAAFLDVDADVETRVQRMQIGADICERIGYGHGAIEIMHMQMLLHWRTCQFDDLQISAARIQAIIAREGWRFSSYVPEIHYYRGEAHYLTNQLTKAREFLQLAIETGRTDGPKSAAFTYAAQLLLQMCDAAEAPDGRLIYDFDADAAAWTDIVRGTSSALTHSGIAWPRLLRDFRAGNIAACRNTYESLQTTPASLDARTFERLRLVVLAGAIFSGSADDVVTHKLAELRTFLEATCFDIMRLQVIALQALHAHQRADTEAARAFLQELTPDIERTGIVRLLLDLPPLQPLLAEYHASFAPPPSTGIPAAPAMPNYGLTRQERRILKLLSDDCDPKDIAAALSLSVGTVRGHVLRIYRKLGVHSRDEAVHIAQEAGVGNSR